MVTVWEQQVDDAVYTAIVDAADSYGVPRSLMLALAKFESGFRPNALLNTSREYSVGLFQLNMRGGVGTGYTEAQLKDPVFNSNVADRKLAAEYKISGNWWDAASAWSTRAGAFQWLKDHGETDFAGTSTSPSPSTSSSPALFTEEFLTQKPVIIAAFIALLLIGVLSLSNGRQQYI